VTACTGRGSGVAATNTGRSGVHSTNPDHLVPSAASPTNVPPLRIADLYAAGRGMTELDLVKLRELAAELGYWPASTDEEHVARLRAQDARYAEQAAQDPDGTKWQKMMPSRGSIGRIRSG